MKISFVIPFHTARLDNILQVLKFLTTNHCEMTIHSELILVCQDTTEFNPKYNNLLEISSFFKKYKIINLEEEEMTLSKMINFGVSSTMSDRVVVLESDRILPVGYFEQVFNELKPKVCITCKNMKKLTKPTTDEEIISNTFEYNDEQRSEENNIGTRNMWSGNTAFWRDDFFEADKMDEGYVGYGWADSDMTNKMKEIGVKSIFRPEVELHLWHPSQTYGKADQKALFIQNGIRYCRKWNIEYPDWFKEEIAKHRKVII